MAQATGEQFFETGIPRLDSGESISHEPAGGAAEAAGVGSNKSVSQALGLNIPSYTDAALDAMEFPPGEVSQENLRYFELKTIYDRVLAGILLVILSPVLLICMIAIRVNSPGNPIFSQRRTGTGGKTFTMYKLRSMYRNAEQKSGPQWSQPGDARVTVVGRFLRFSHLDEIPQLFNVLRGEMALVGPRPERPSIVKELIPLVPGYEKRHAVRPGITGLAQIYLPPDEDLKSVKAKVVYDLIYIRYAGFAMDVRIAVCTVLRMVGIRGGLGPQWTGLSRRVDAIRDLNRQRAAQRRGIERPQGVAAVAGEQRIQRLNQVEQGFSSKDSGITSLIGDSAAPAKTKRATTQSSSAEEPRRATENRPTKKRPRPISNSKPR